MQLQPLPWQQQTWSSLAQAIHQQKLAHALLLVGPRGVGKRHFATLLSHALLCAQTTVNSLPCGRCHTCALLNAGTHPDLHRLEKEEGSKVVKVDDVREFNRKVFLTPSSDRGNVGIIDPVDGLNRSSANALLKSLEEPPKGTHILLIGERWQSLPATLRSRCLTVRFPMPGASYVREWLKAQSGATTPNPAHDQMKARYQPDMTRQRGWIEALAALCSGKTDPVQLAERWQKPDEELPVLIDWLHGCVADMLKLKHHLEPEHLSNPEWQSALRTIADRLSAHDLLELARRVLDGKRLLETQAKPQMVLENMLASWYQSSMSTADAKKGAGIR